MSGFLKAAPRVTVALLFAVGVTAGALTYSVSDQDARADNGLNTYQQLDLFGEVFERIRAEYVDDVTDEELVEAAISGMLNSLDPHSSYMDPETFEGMQVQTRGSFGGLGIEVTMENGLVRVVSPIDGTPADEAGIRAGDFITQIDGEPVMGMDLSEAVEIMRGPVGSGITVTVVRGDEEPFDVEMERDTIRIESVRWEAHDDIAYIRISSFTEQTTSGLREAIDEIEEEMAESLSGIVLDMRNNPGGLLDQAVDVSNLFLSQGEIVSTRPRDEDRAQRFNATEDTIADGIPMVVLINDGSASASEIVAGALQDHRRAIVLGTDSYGKGSVQTVIPLPGNGAMRLTTARHYTPSGRSIQAKGIAPDIEVRQALLEEIDRPPRREADLRGALENLEDFENLPFDPTEGDIPEALMPDAEGDTEDEAEAELEDDEEFDYQLARAMDLLRGMSLFKDFEMR